MSIRSTLAGIAGVCFVMAASNPAAAQCPPGCDGPTNWSGFWLGVGVGGTYDMIEHSFVNTDSSGAAPTYDRGDEQYRGAAGVIGTVGAGFDWQVRDRWVVGAFGDFDFGNSEHKTTITWDNSGVAGSTGVAHWRIKHNRTWTLGGRLGLVTSNSSMIYGLIGYSQADLDVSEDATDSDAGSASHSEDLTLRGLTLGAGLEQDLGSGFSLKGEYRYTNYGSKDFGPVTDLSGAEETDKFDMNSHSVRMSLVYKFGRSDDVVEEVSYKDLPPAPAPYK